MGGLANDMVQQIARKQAGAFRLPTAQDGVLGWWDAPHSICSLSRRDFLPHQDFHRMRDFRKTQKEETLVLAMALQHCAEKSVVPSRVLCNVVWDLQRCMAPLIMP